MAIICIDPGHGGSDSGGTGLGRREKDDVLSICLKIRSLLENQGVTVIMTRTGDKDITIASRCALANEKKCDYFLSVHRDAFRDATANGSSIYVYSKASDATVAKAQKIYDSVITASGFKRRGLKRGAASYTDYGVNRNTNMSAALLELGFITNKNDNKLFNYNIDNIALGIAQALCDILGVIITPSVKEAATEENTDSNEPVETGDAPGYSQRVYEWQLAAVKDGFSFPRYGADGVWGEECAAVASKAIVEWRSDGYRNKTLTALVQNVVGAKADGLCGRKTDAAIRAWQRAHGLTVDGAIGIKSWRVMLQI